MSLKALTLGLQSNVVSVYDQTKTTYAGGVAQSTLGGVPIVSIPRNKWLDVFTDSGEIPSFIFHTAGGRIYVISTISVGLARVMCYSFNYTTGVASYLGKLQLTFPNLAATTHTIRGFRVDDSNTAAIKMFITTTGTVSVNGGLFMANGIALSDFTPILANTLGFANGSNQKAMYFLQDPANEGAGNLNIASAGVSIDTTGQIVYVHNGVSVTHQFYLFDYSLTPNVASQAFTVTIATPGVITAAAHGLNSNDPFVPSTTGALPTGMVAGTTYFARNVTTNTFEFSATSGGASTATTGTQSGTHSFVRAFGMSSSLFKWKTGNLPALVGTLLLNNSERAVTPFHTINTGSLCVFFATTTALYLGKLSELTSGAVTWPSLVTANLLGAANQVVTPTALNAEWDESYDTAFFISTGPIAISKQMVNNVIGGTVTILNNQYLEGISQTDLIAQSGATVIGDVKAKYGWSFILGTATGQRGIVGTDEGADGVGLTSYIISQVFNLNSLSALVGVALASTANQSTTQCTVYYRTSGFGSATGGWVALTSTNLFPSGVYASQVQFKVTFSTVTNPYLTNPSFVIEGYVAYAPISSLSDYWEGSVDNTTQNGASPARTAFRMLSTYSTSVPRLYFKAYDDSGTLVASGDTVTNAALFEYSTNNGTSWNALGTIPNTALTTELRYNWASPPGVRVTCSLNES